MLAKEAILKPAQGTFVLLLILSLSVSNAQSAPITIVYGRSWPRSIAVDSSRGLVYIDGMSGDYPPTGYSFGIINASTHLLVRVLPLDVISGEMALNPTTGDVYVAGSDSIEVFDGGTQSFVKQIAVGVPLLYIVYDNGTGDVFFSAGDRVYQVDPRTGALVKNTTVGIDAEGIVINPSNGDLYVADFLSGLVTVLDASTLAQIETIQLPSPCYPSQLVLDMVSQVLYVTTDENTIDVVDTRSNTFVRSIAVAPLASNSTLAIALDQRSNQLFVLTEPGTTISQVDVSTGTVVGRFSLESAAYEMAFDQATGELYVSVYHQLSVFSPVQAQSNASSLGVLAATVLLGAAVVVLVVLALQLRSKGRPRRPDSIQPHS